MLASIDQIVEYALNAFPGVQDDCNWGERALFYNPSRQLPKGVYFLTFKEKDGANDKASQIEPGYYRLNVGIPKSAFIARFGRIPARPSAGEVVNTDHDFTISDVITPHPVYGWMSWIAVKNPTLRTLDELKPLLSEAYQLAVSKFKKRIAPGAGNAAQHR